jgi:hypothetical protein
MTITNPFTGEEEILEPETAWDAEPDDLESWSEYMRWIWSTEETEKS